MIASSSSFQADSSDGAITAEPQHEDALVVDCDDDSVIVFDESDDDIPSEKRLSPLDSAIHLIKGNLGPGCLNLPHAFALSGWALGSGLFLLIALQGIYSMWLLVYCKNLMERSSHHHTITFMDVAKAALGTTGGHLVEIFLFVLQGGVCCVFLSLIRTNLNAFCPWLSDIASVLVVTAGLMFMVLLRFLKGTSVSMLLCRLSSQACTELLLSVTVCTVDLLWLSASANIIMVIAILTATVAGLMHFSPSGANIIAANPAPSIIVTFASDMFFAFEGIGLVLPVENSYYSHQKSFSSILIGSMTLVAFLFVLIGLSASLGFPDVHSGSITAYLEKQYPDVIWFSIVNALVIVAVALTFPLQLTPAMQVLDKWLDHCDCRGKRREASDASIEVTRYSVAQHVDAEEVTIQNEPTVSSLDRASCCGIKVWIYRRWFVVLGCALIVYFVDNLGLLIMTVGAIGQTALAGMPCAIHLAMQYQGTAPRKRLHGILDIVVLFVCGIVMISGLITSITEILKS